LLFLPVVRTARSLTCRHRDEGLLRRDAAISRSLVVQVRVWDAHDILTEERQQLFGGTPMNEQETSNTPSERQRKYLGRLLAKAHEHGVPYLPTEQLTRAQVSAWIDYLKLVVGEEVDA
jgi:hypothetical protein